MVNWVIIGSDNDLLHSASSYYWINAEFWSNFDYCQTSNIGHTKSHNLNVSLLILQLSLPDPLKPGIKSRMKMYLEQRRQAMLQLHLSDQHFYCLLMYDLY